MRLDNQKRLTILTQQSSGVTSQRDGEIEVSRISLIDPFLTTFLDLAGQNARSR